MSEPGDFQPRRHREALQNLPRDIRMSSVSVSTGGVSIMMPAYNVERYVARATDSVLAQSFANWELILVDDGSTDRTGEIAALCRDPRIRVLHQENRGEAAARNAALDHVQGEYVAFLDADDVWLPRHLELTVDHLRLHPERSGVYTDGYYITEDEQYLKTLSSRRRGPMIGRVFDEVVRGSDVFGPPVCVVLRHEPIRQHGLRFDEDIVIGPDWDFFTQFADVGTFGYVDAVTCLYRVHRANITMRVGLQRRAFELAKCREKAVKMASFGSCPLDVRVGVFYDLLVNLLRKYPSRQAAVVESPQFRALPPAEQARLLRLMASKAMALGDDGPSVRQWLGQSRRVNHGDWRGALLFGLYQASPALCAMLLRLRPGSRYDPAATPPFADLGLPAE